LSPQEEQDYITEQQLVKSGYSGKANPAAGTEVWTAHPGAQVQMAVGFSILPAQDLGLPKPRPVSPTVTTTVLTKRRELGL